MRRGARIKPGVPTFVTGGVLSVIDGGRRFAPSPIGRDDLSELPPGLQFHIWIDESHAARNTVPSAFSQCTNQIITVPIPVMKAAKEPRACY